MSDEKLLDTLTEIAKDAKTSQGEYESENEKWWSGLSEREREDAFFAVIKRMYKAEVIDQGSYRHALYNVFGFDPGSYGLGMECGYMDLHNLIVEGQYSYDMGKATRIEVVEGRDETAKTLLSKTLEENEFIDLRLGSNQETLIVKVKH